MRKRCEIEEHGKPLFFLTARREEEKVCPRANRLRGSRLRRWRQRGLRGMPLVARMSSSDSHVTLVLRTGSERSLIRCHGSFGTPSSVGLTTVKG
jgi:hypothetical protein